MAQTYRSFNKHHAQEFEILAGENLSPDSRVSAMTPAVSTSGAKAGASRLKIPGTSFPRPRLEGGEQRLHFRAGCLETKSNMGKTICQGPCCRRTGLVSQVHCRRPWWSGCTQLDSSRSNQSPLLVPQQLAGQGPTAPRGESTVVACTYDWTNGRQPRGEAYKPLSSRGGSAARMRVLSASIP